jgi:2-methylcitrate dehydratase PrpD
MLQTEGIMDFLLSSEWKNLPINIYEQSKLCLLDLIGVAAGGSRTKLSRIARDYAQMDMTGTIPMIFDGRGASVAGVALSSGMTIDALDSHDGFNLAKGHVGCNAGNDRANANYKAVMNLDQTCVKTLFSLLAQPSN